MHGSYIQRLIDEKELPGAVIAIRKDGELKHLESYGSYKDKKDKWIDVTNETIFDVASLTKVMATLPSVLLLQEKKELAIDDRVQKYLPAFSHQDVTIKHLLQHSSGLSADLPYKSRAESRDVLTPILNGRLTYKPGTRTEYSDLGMILLGEIVKVISNQALDEFSRDYLFKPWGMNDTAFLPDKAELGRIASTEMFQGNYIQGEVHDEKAHQLGGVSGSAGLFSTAKDVSKYTYYWLYPDTQNVLSRESMELARQDVLNNRGLGFEVWQGTGKPLSCGRGWSRGSFGHTGFTGTSLWIDPIEMLSVVFLTNVVHYGRKHRLQEIRQELHSMVHASYAVM